MSASKLDIAAGGGPRVPALSADDQRCARKSATPFIFCGWSGDRRSDALVTGTEAGKIEAPGLLLDSAFQPRLFPEINAIAAAQNEPMPSKVYMIGEVNALVAERGGS
jgi:hypothetical protein